MAGNIKTILAVVNNKIKIISGDGPLSNKKSVRFYSMLIGTSAEVKATKDNDLALDRLQAKGL